MVRTDRRTFYRYVVERMSRFSKFLIFATLAICVAVSVAVYQFWGERYKIVLTEEQLIAKWNEKFPFEKTYLFVFTLRFSNPNMELEDGSNRIAFGCDIETKLKLQINSEDGVGVLRGTGKLSGKIRYESSEGAFFLDEPTVESLDVGGIPEKWRTKVNESAYKATREFLSRAPIYRLRPTDLKKAAARLVLRDVQVIDKKLIITMGVG